MRENSGLGVLVNPLDFLSFSFRGGVRKYFDEDRYQGSFPANFKIVTNIKW